MSPSVMPMTRPVNVSADAEPASRSKSDGEGERVPSSRAAGQGVQDGRDPLPARCPRRLGGLPVQQPKRGGPLAAVDHVDPHREDLAVDGGTDLGEAPRFIAEPLEHAAGLCHRLPSREEVCLRLGEAAGGSQSDVDERARLVDRGGPQASCACALGQLARRLLALPLELRDPAR